jgi:hypothetical protein
MHRDRQLGQTVYFDTVLIPTLGFTILCSDIDWHMAEVG